MSVETVGRLNVMHPYEGVLSIHDRPATTETYAMPNKRKLTNKFDLLCLGAGIALSKEYKFHPTRKWRFDYADIEKKIAVEIEGGTWINGRHNRPLGMSRDAEKYNNAILCGWKVFRLTTDMVNAKWVEIIKKYIERVKI